MLLFSILLAVVIVPAILSGTVVRRLKGWVRGIAIPFLLIGLTAMPYIWLAPKISEANKSSIDAGGYIGIAMIFLMATILLSTLVGFAVGGVIVRRRRREQPLDITTVF